MFWADLLDTKAGLFHVDLKRENGMIESEEAMNIAERILGVMGSALSLEEMSLVMTGMVGLLCATLEEKSPKALEAFLVALDKVRGDIAAAPGNTQND